MKKFLLALAAVSCVSFSVMARPVWEHNYTASYERGTGTSVYNSSNKVGTSVNNYCNRPETMGTFAKTNCSAAIDSVAAGTGAWLGGTAGASVGAYIGVNAAACICR